TLGMIGWAWWRWNKLSGQCDVPKYGRNRPAINLPRSQTLFGNACSRNSVSRAALAHETGVSRKCVPKQSLGTRGQNYCRRPNGYEFLAAGRDRFVETGSFTRWRQPEHPSAGVHFRRAQIPFSLTPQRSRIMSLVSFFGQLKSADRK